MQQAAPITKYGIEKLGRLKKVMVHKPVHSLKIINSANNYYYLFDKVPDVDKYLEEHDQYTNLLKSLDIEVYELSDYVYENQHLIDTLPSLPYLHDSSVITKSGAILSRMVSTHGRKGEDIVVKEALMNLGIPIYYEFKEEDTFEGCLLLSPDTLFIADTERHSKASIETFIPAALHLFKEVIYAEIPQARRFMHPDMIYNRISEHLSLIYLPAFLNTYLITDKKRTVIDFKEYMKSKDIELINISDEEQQKWGCSFVPLEPNTIINYDISLTSETQKDLERRGVQIISLHPDALLAGGGSLRCLTLRILRE